MRSASGTPPKLQDTRRQIEFVVEAGGVFISYRLLDESASRLPGVWAILFRLLLPVVLILGWRLWAGEPWKIRDTGIARRSKGGWLEGLWLLAFQTTFLLGILLGIARFRFYDLFGLLIEARDRLNCYPADYGPFVLASALFAAIRFAWGGELLCRGLAQGLGTIRSNAAAGAVTSWLAFGAMAASLALQLGYPLIPALLWALFALLPGPVCEAYYFRNRSVLPLMAIRAVSCSLAIAGVGFFLYWYPDRSFSTALPLAWSSLLVLLLVTVIGVRRLVPFWQTASTMIQIGFRRGSFPAVCLAAIIVADGVVRNLAVRLGLCVAALTLVFYLRTGREGSARRETTALRSDAPGERPGSSRKSRAR